MAQGRGRKPRHLKVLSGTNQPCRDDTIELAAEPLAGVPEPPSFIAEDEEAVAQWKKLAEVLVATGIFTEPMILPLANYCMIGAEIARIWQTGKRPSAEMVSQYRHLTNDFGFSPAGAGRIKRPGAKRDKNPFDVLDD